MLSLAEQVVLTVPGLVWLAVVIVCLGIVFTLRALRRPACSTARPPARGPRRYDARVEPDGRSGAPFPVLREDVAATTADFERSATAYHVYVGAAARGLPASVCSRLYERHGKVTCMPVLRLASLYELGAADYEAVVHTVREQLGLESGPTSSGISVLAVATRTLDDRAKALANKILDEESEALLRQRGGAT